MFSINRKVFFAREQDIISQVAHRPFVLPSQPWLIHQKCRNIVFNHWQLEPELLERYLPEKLKLDTFKGKGWITISSVEVVDMKMRNLPLIPMASQFLEVNVRTYVIYKNVPGLYYFSLDASSWFSVFGAKMTSALPYFNADIILHRKEDGSTFIQSKRKSQPPAEYIISYKPLEDVYEPQKKTLDHWLTERYSLFTQVKGNYIHRYVLHHLPWKLQKAEIALPHNTMTFPLGLILDSNNKLSHYAHHQDLFIWNSERVT